MRKIILLTMVLTMFCAGFGAKKEVLRMATKPMTEQYILGAMLKKLIEQNTGLSVEVSAGIGGGTSNIQPAIIKGEFDFYPEYTGTGWNMVLKKNNIYNESMFDELRKGYEGLGLSWLGMTGFNNTFGLAARKDIADKYGLKTFSDLAPVADKLRFGAEYDFYEREDGYPALCEAYGFKFGDTMDMDIGLKYDAIRQGKIDVLNIFTTDGQLSTADVAVLEDDKGLYPSYACGFVVRNETLEKYPQLKDIFAAIAGKISDREMAEMNYLVEGKGREPEDVAADFLKRKNLIK